MAELCHGCGGCRGHQSMTGGVMCPTYRAAEEESLSTRGRANMLRQAMSGDLPGGSEEAFDVEFMSEVMDLCIGCEGCAQDCPSEVDMAKMKAEITHEHHQRYGATLRDRLFTNVDRLSTLGSPFAPVSNWATAVSGARELLERTVGIAADRRGSHAADLPRGDIRRSIRSARTAGLGGRRRSWRPPRAGHLYQSQPSRSRHDRSAGARSRRRPCPASAGRH